MVGHALEDLWHAGLELGIDDWEAIRSSELELGVSLVLGQMGHDESYPLSVSARRGGKSVDDLHVDGNSGGGEGRAWRKR
jgi:hypothetical protein